MSRKRDQATQMPILRPLVGMDKEEIVAEAIRIGTYEISVIPDQDCCQLFTLRSPESHARRWQVEEAESKLPIEGMVKAAFDAMVTEDFRFPKSTMEISD